MRRLAYILGGFAAGLLSFATPAIAAGTSRDECNPRQRDIAVKTAQVVVFRDREGGLWGCRRGIPRAVYIIDPPSEDSGYSWSAPVVAGDWVATIEEAAGHCINDDLIRVNLRTGERREYDPVSTTSSPSPANDCDDSNPAEVLRLRSDGAAATIADAGADGREVVLVRVGRVAVGKTIDPRSLRWTSAGLVWTDAEGEHEKPFDLQPRPVGTLDIKRAPSTVRATVAVRDRAGHLVARRVLHTRTSVRLPAGAYSLRIASRSARVACNATTLVYADSTVRRRLVLRTHRRGRCSLQAR